MASVYDPLKQQQTQQQNQQQAQQQVQQTQTAEPAQQQTQTQQAPAYTGLQGVKGNTAQMVGQTQQAWQPSDNVNNALNYLNSIQQKDPGTWDAQKNQFYQQATDILGQIQNKGKFQYDINQDALYQQAKDQYVRNAQQAMIDTTGQMQTQTGGYGNSYAATAGNQVYQQNLQNLAALAPEYYDRALAADNAERDRLQNLMGLNLNMYGVDQDAYNMELNKNQADRNFGLGAYETMYNQDYGRNQDDRNYWWNIATGENSQFNTDRSQDYSTAMMMLQNGLMPTPELLNAAGIADPDARNIAAKYGWVDPETGAVVGGEVDDPLAGLGLPVPENPHNKPVSTNTGLNVNEDAGTKGNGNVLGLDAISGAQPKNTTNNWLLNLLK